MRRRAADPQYFLLAAAKSRAKRAGPPFAITRDDVPIPPVCPALGIPIVHRVGVGKADIDSSPSIDRIDPGLGYVPGNVVVVSFRANRIKNDATLPELEAIADFLRKRNTT